MLFADLSGFTRASEDMDPEDVRSMVDRCMHKLGSIVEEFGGHVDKIVGDELMAVFGARAAHGDDAERAVRAALAMQKCRVENEDIFSDLGLHIGINTGEMMFAPVGPGSEARDFTVMGDAVNVASRLVSAAPAESVFVGHETYKATNRAIAYEEREPIEAKGKTEPVRVWSPTRALSAPAERPISSAPIIGRDSELKVMKSLWERVKLEKRPHLLTIIGPPGIGKTRLARELISHVTEEKGLVLRGRSLPYGEMTGYGSFVQQLKEAAGVLDSDPPSEALAKFDELARDLLGAEADDTGQPLKVILGLASEGMVAETPAILLAARRLVEALGNRRPTLLLFEDIHWADPSLLDLIRSLGSRMRETRVIALCLARPQLLEARPEWGAGLPGYSAISLDPLSPEASAELATRLLSRRGLVEADVVAARAEGNPLFIEELAASVAEGGVDQAKHLPGGIREIIAARLDALPVEERQTLLEASVIGKVFWRGAVSNLVGRQDVDALLDSLEARDFIRREPRSQLKEDQEFTFKHMLIREVAYSTLPRARRKQSHAAVAQFIEEAAAERLDESASLLAYHWLEAEEVAKAIDYQLIAADKAARAWAKGESLALFDEALSLVPEEDEGKRTSILFQRAQLKVQMGDYAGALKDLDVVIPRLEGRQLGLALVGKMRCAYWLTDAAGARAAAEQAHRVIEDIGDTEVKALMNIELMEQSTMSGDFRRAWQHADLAVRNWPSDVVNAGRASLHSQIGHWRYVQGDFEEALEQGRRGYELAMELQALEPLMIGGSAVATALIGLNRPEEAIEFLTDLTKRSGEIEVAPRMTGRAINMIAGALREIFDLEGARNRNEEAIELGRQAAFPNVIFQGRADLIYVDLAAGDVGAAQAAIPKMMEDIPALKGWHEWLVRGRVQQARAEAALAAGNFEDAAGAARAAIEEAKGMRRKYETLGMIVYASSLVGLKELEKAQRAFEQALDLAEQLKHSPTLWRCLAGASQLQHRLGNDDAAAALSERAISLIERYASSLTETHKQGFLAAESVHKILMGKSA